MSALERGLLRSGSVLLGGQVVYRLSVAGYTIVLVSLLTKAEYGDFAVLIAVVSIGAAVADGGITRLLTRDVARSDHDRGWLVRGLLTVRTVWIAAVLAALIVVVLLGALPLKHGGSMLAAIMVVAVLGEAGAAGLEAASVGAEVPRRVAVGQVLAAVTLAATLIVLLVTQASIAAAIAGLALGSIARLGWNLAGWWEEIRSSDPGPDSDTVRAWVREAAPFLMLAMLGAIYYRVDVVILHAIRGATEAASYAAAYRVLDAAIVLGGAIVTALVPRLSQMGTRHPQHLWPLWRRWARVVGALGGVATVLVIAAASPLAELLFGERYRVTAGDDLRLLAPSIAFVLLQSLNAAFLFALDRQRALVRLSLVNVAVNVVLTAALADLGGSGGAAAATTVSSMFTFAYFAFILHGSLTPRPAED